MRSLVVCFQCKAQNIANDQAFSLFNFNRSSKYEHCRNSRNSISTKIYFYFFTDDFFKLSMRKPFLFSICRTLQHWISKSNALNRVMYRTFDNIVQTKITSPGTIGNLFSLLRHSLFPNDNMMGPPRVLPVGDAFLEFREECISNLWDICMTYKLDHILAIKRSDIADLIICISKNRDCNKLLIYRIIDCVIAQLP